MSFPRSKEIKPTVLPGTLQESNISHPGTCCPLLITQEYCTTGSGVLSVPNNRIQFLIIGGILLDLILGMLSSPADTTFRSIHTQAVLIWTVDRTMVTDAFLRSLISSETHPIIPKPVLVPSQSRRFPKGWCFFFFLNYFPVSTYLNN